MLIPNFIMVWPNFDLKPPDFEDLAFEDEKLFGARNLFRSVQLIEYVAKITENHFSRFHERF